MKKNYKIATQVYKMQISNNYLKIIDILCTLFLFLSKVLSLTIYYLFNDISTTFDYLNTTFDRSMSV